MDFILTIVGAFLASMFISAIILAFIQMIPNSIENKYSIFIPAIILTIILVLVDMNDVQTENTVEELTLNSTILEEETKKLEEEKHELKSQLDTLESEYEYSQDLIEVLRDQLETHGIEPADL